MIYGMGFVGLAIYLGGIYGMLCPKTYDKPLVSVMLVVLGFGLFLGALLGVTI